MSDLDGLAWFNLAEATIWFVFGASLLTAAASRPLGYHLGRRAGVAFLCFGASDLLEMETGAWFRPWWLLVWKATCVLVLGWVYWTYRELLKSGSESPTRRP